MVLKQVAFFKRDILDRPIDADGLRDHLHVVVSHLTLFDYDTFDAVVCRDSLR